MWGWMRQNDLCLLTGKCLSWADLNLGHGLWRRFQDTPGWTRSLCWTTLVHYIHGLRLKTKKTTDNQGGMLLLIHVSAQRQEILLILTPHMLICSLTNNCKAWFQILIFIVINTTCLNTDSENAIKVRVSLKAALGDEAVRSLFDLLLILKFLHILVCFSI